MAPVLSWVEDPVTVGVSHTRGWVVVGGPTPGPTPGPAMLGVWPGPGGAAGPPLAAGGAEPLPLILLGYPDSI